MYSRELHLHMLFRQTMGTGWLAVHSLGKYDVGTLSLSLEGGVVYGCY
jgi:hypothetical protein